MKITYALLCKDRTNELKKAVRRHAPHVDHSIVILHGANEDNIAFLESQECKEFSLEYHITEIPYDPSSLRGQYLSRVKEGWLLHTDSDEYVSDEGCYMLRQVAQEAENRGYNMVGFNAHDIQIDFEGKVHENRTTYWNPMFFKVVPGIFWGGQTHGGIVRPGMVPNVAQVDYRYYHVKSTASQWLRGCRNYWTTGRSAQNDTNVPEWVEFKKLCVRHGFDQFHQMFEAMKEGNLHEDFKQWFVLHRNNENPEARSWFVCYFVLLHPEENHYTAGSRDFAFDKNRKPYTGEMTY